MFEEMIPTEWRVSRRVAMFNGRGMRIVSLLVILAALTGCGSGNAASEKPASSSSTPTAAPRKTKTTSPKIAAKTDVTSPEPNVESEPVSVAEPITEEQREAAAAFETMTAEGVSPDDIDAATDTLLTLGAPAVPVLAAGLASQETLEREMAATILAQMGADASGATKELIAALKDESVFVRANAATALAQIDGHAEHVMPVFSEFLEGDDEHLRRMAAMNLAVLDVSAVKPLVGNFIDALQIDDREVRLAIVELLGRIGPDAREAVDALKALDTADDPELQTTVTAALLQIDEEPEPEQ